VVTLSISARSSGAGADPGLVHQDIQPAVPRDGVGNHPVDRFLVGDVEHHGVRSAGLREARRINIGIDHRRAFPRQAVGDGAPDPARRPRDQRHPSAEIDAHSASPVSALPGRAGLSLPSCYYKLGGVPSWQQAGQSRRDRLGKPCRTAPPMRLARTVRRCRTG
jgi:hypothetical protein